MSKFLLTINQQARKIVLLFFLGYLALGLSIYKDYGVPWDEIFNYEIGAVTQDYILQGRLLLLNCVERYRGSIFELFQVALKDLLFGIHQGDTRFIVLMRHVIVFLFFFTGVFFFYRLCRDRFKDWKIGLLGCLLLILSPRIFADSFYNSRDIVFLSSVIIGFWTLRKFIAQKTIANAFLHALVSAVAIDIRPIGLIIPVITIFEYFLTIPGERKKTVHSVFVYSISLVIFVYLFWPVLWSNPLYHFMMALQESAKFPRPIVVLYLGRDFNSSQLPWHYLPVWILISTPMAYSAFFFLGFCSSLKGLCCSCRDFFSSKIEDLGYLLWFLLPLFMVFVMKPVFDGWRHMFFMYPAFLIIALIGVTTALEKIKSKAWRRPTVFLSVGLVLMLILNVLSTALFMIRNHPFQNVYLNRLAGRNLEEAATRFEMDYWGLSLRKGLEYIFKNDQDAVIKIYGRDAQLPIYENTWLLPKKDRKRFSAAKKISEAKYSLRVFRWHKEGYRFEREVYSVKVDGAKIMAVYKLHE